MENSDSDEQEKKRPHLNSLSPTMARSSTTSPPNNHSDLEAKIKELKDKQGSYDEMLITVNQIWNQLVDDLILLGLCAGGSQNALQILDGTDYSRGILQHMFNSIMFCGGDVSLCLLQRDSIEANGNDEIAKYVEEALTLRHTSTRELLKLLEHTIYSHREKTESMVHTLDGKISSEDAIIQLPKIDDMMEREVKNLREAIDILHVKQKEYADVIRTYLSSQSTDQSEISRITGELDDSMTELEESRGKLVNLKMQKEVASGMHNLTSGAVNGTYHLKNQQKGQ
ncbi:unnamed protein product [Prunus armeniaca]